MEEIAVLMLNVIRVSSFVAIPFDLRIWLNQTEG